MSDQHAPAPPRTPPGRFELWAVLCLIGAEFLDFNIVLALPAWLAGCVMLMLSSVWTWRQKIRGWVFLASGLPLLVVTAVIGSRCAETGACGGSAAAWVIGILLVAYFVAQTVTALRLLGTGARPAGPSSSTGGESAG